MFSDPAVGSFAREHAAELRYHEWLQWLLDRQLARAVEALPLLQDLPVGVQPGGADAWIWQDLLAKDCTVGAPPDVFNSAGQDWGLPPFIPHKFREAGYQPFVETIRASLRHAGGLRIDHVMGLFRLFWVPAGKGPADGAYVRYCPDELLAIVALESQRAGAFIVGEDLGNVEDQVREVLAAEHILSFRLLWFEPRMPPEYPELALAAVTTHDLPTIAGLWDGQAEKAWESSGCRSNSALGQLRRHFAQMVGLPAGRLGRRDRADLPLAGPAPSLLLIATLDDALAVAENPTCPARATSGRTGVWHCLAAWRPWITLNCRGGSPAR